ncbi:MAG: hemolysin family protein, partial [Verrucomicrobia bacterium]|nr:hemolysin family protein [Verrucomicrobiota bacterium]
FSLNTLQIRRLGRKRPKAGKQIEHLLARPTRLLSTILIGNTLVNVGASALGFAVADDLLEKNGEAVAILVMTVLLLVIGEVAPKRLAMSKAEQLALLYYPVLGLLIAISKPIRILLEGITNYLEKHLPGRPKSLSEDEFLTVVEVGEEEGILDKEERTMVDGIIRLEETQASDVMTPRVDFVGIDLDDPLEENKALARSVKFRYLPLYRETADKPVGFLDVPKFLLSNNDDFAAATIAPFFVPETVPLDSLLVTFQKEHRRVAFVADEYGGTAGLITRGDLLEEIAPDVDNELGEPKFTIQRTGENSWLIDGITSLEDINYELDTLLEAEGVDRIGGWIAAQMERIPKTGEFVEAQSCRVTVQQARRNRVTRVLLEKLTPNIMGGATKDD